MQVTSQEAATSDFYKTSMTLNEETWNLSLVPMKGYPELKGMEKREVISVKTAEDFMKMKDFPTQEYRLKSRHRSVRNRTDRKRDTGNFSGVLDGENHKITGLKAPLFGQLSGTVSNVAIDAGAIEIGNSVDTTVGIFANTMTNATVEKVMIANGSISSTAGKAAGFAGTVTDSTVKNIFHSRKSKCSFDSVRFRRNVPPFGYGKYLCKHRRKRGRRRRIPCEQYR